MELSLDANMDTLLPADTKVVLKNLKSRADLNGKFGTIKCLLKGNTRYCVQLPCGAEVSIAVENVQKSAKAAKTIARDKENSNSNKNDNKNDSNIVTTIEELKRAFETCTNGSVIQLAACRLKPTNTSDVIIPGKALTIQGSTTGKSILECTLKTTKGAKGGVLKLNNLNVHGGFDIEDNEYKEVLVNDCNFACGVGGGRDCVTVGSCNGNCVFRNTVISGGSDGLMHTSHNTNLTIEKCMIGNAGSRGIFANSHFVIRDSVVVNCGGYGIKCRAGCTVLGDCNIQPGPWDNFGTAGGMKRDGTTYGHHNTFADLGGLNAMMARLDPNYWE